MATSDNVPHLAKRFTVVLLPDVVSGGYTTLVPTLPGCVPHGATIDEALTNAEEAIAVYLHREEIDPSLERECDLRVVVAQVSVD